MLILNDQAPLKVTLNDVLDYNFRSRMFSMDLLFNTASFSKSRISSSQNYWIYFGIIAVKPRASKLNAFVFMLVADPASRNGGSD